MGPINWGGIEHALSLVWSGFGDAVTTANANPVMWVGVGFGIAGATVGLLRRASRVGGRRR